MQKQYSYLLTEPGPKIITKAMELYGTKEYIGKTHNPVIMGWAEETKVKGYTTDEIPWCGLFMAVVALRAGFQPVKDPLWARNWTRFGTPAKEAVLSSILTFDRPGGGGHVGLYVGEDATYYHVLGGNQNNMVNIIRIAKSRCIGIRNCPWKIKQPDNVRKIYLADGGTPISTNEA